MSEFQPNVFQRNKESFPEQSLEESANENEFRYDVFISYSHSNKKWVNNQLLQILFRNDFKVCIDEQSFEVGAPVLEEITRAANQSRKVIIILTPAYLKSEYTKFETQIIQHLDTSALQRRIIPILLEPCEIPDNLKHLIYLDMVDPSTHNKIFNKLIAALRS